MAQKVVARSGSWFKYGETHLGQGKEKARQFLMDNPQIAEEIKEKVLSAGGYGIAASSDDADQLADAE